MNAELITSNSNYDVYEGYWMTINGDEYLFHNFWKFEQIVAWMLLGFSFLTAAGAFITGLIKPL